MDDIDQRLRDTSEQCYNSFQTWHGDKKNVEAREALLDAVHELRKVASRIEIELATTERSESKSKPLPIPMHRNAGRGQRDGNTTEGNKGNKNTKPKRRPPQKKSES